MSKAEVGGTDLLHSFDAHIMTSMPVKHYRLKWTFNDFSKLPLQSDFTSSTISPLPSYRLHLIFSKEEDYLYLYLVNTSETDIKFNLELAIVDLDNKRWYSDKQDNFVLPKDTKEDLLDDSIKDIMPDVNSFRDDTVIIICDFNIINLNTVTYQMPQKEDMPLNYTQKKLLADLKTMYESQRHTDLTVIADNGELHVHKSLLCARSPVFEKMFNHQTVENQQSTIEIVDAKLPELKKLVNFLYFCIYEAEEDIEKTYSLYYVADKYEILDLRKMCADTLLHILSEDNVAQILTWADQHEDSYLKNRARDFFVGHFDNIVDSELWNKFLSNETKLAIEVLKYYSKRLTLKT